MSRVQSITKEHAPKNVQDIYGAIEKKWEKSPTYSSIWATQLPYSKDTSA